MTEYYPDEFEFEIDPKEPLFVIGVVSKMVDIPIWTLRKLDELGIVCPERLGGKIRCYSKVQVKKLNYVHYLMIEKRVNIYGIKVILQIGKEDGNDQEIK